MRKLILCLIAFLSFLISNAREYKTDYFDCEIDNVIYRICQNSYYVSDNFGYTSVAGAYVIGVTPNITSISVPKTITVPAELNKFNHFVIDEIYDVLGLNTIKFQGNNLKRISLTVNHTNTTNAVNLDASALAECGLRPGLYFDENFSPNNLEDFNISYKNDNDELEYTVDRIYYGQNCIEALIEKTKVDYSTHRTLVCVSGAAKVFNSNGIEYVDSVGIALANSNLEMVILNNRSINEKVLQNCDNLKTVILTNSIKNYDWMSYLPSETRILTSSGMVNSIKNYWQGEVDIMPGLNQPATVSDGMLSLSMYVPKNFKLDYITYEYLAPSSLIDQTQQLSSDFAKQSEVREYMLPYNPLRENTYAQFYWKEINNPDISISISRDSNTIYQSSPLFTPSLTNSKEQYGYFYLDDNTAEIEFKFSRDLDETIVDFGIFATCGRDSAYFSAKGKQNVAVGPLPFNKTNLSFWPYVAVTQNGDYVKYGGDKITQSYNYTTREEFRTEKPDITVKCTPDKADCVDLSVVIGKRHGESFIPYEFPHNYVGTTFKIDKPYSNEFSSESGTVSFVNFTPGSEFRIVEMSAQINYETNSVQNNLEIK